MEKFYSISKFANLVGVSRQTLIWYDKVDIFSPVKISESGYRYYSLDQLDLFNVIRSLSNLGVSLKEIGTIVNHRTPKQMTTIFEYQSAKLTQEIQQLSNLRDSLQSWTTRINNPLISNLNTVFIEHQKEQHLMRSKKCTEISQNEVAEELTTLNQFRAHSFQLATCVGGMVPREKIYQRKTEFDYYYTQADPEHANFQKGESDYLCIFYKGNYWHTHEVYGHVTDYADQHNLKLGDYMYEQSEISEVFTSDPDEYVNKLSIQILKA